MSLGKGNDLVVTWNIIMSCEKVLIVEDEQIVAMDLRRRLTNMGYQVAGTASNAAKALEVIQITQPDIVLMDIHIQGEVDGIELAATIYRTSSIPVIYLTAFSEQSTINRAKSTKPYGYLLKPFSESELNATIQVALERSKHDQVVQLKGDNMQVAINAAGITPLNFDLTNNDVLIQKSHDGSIETSANWSSLLTRVYHDDLKSVEHTIEKLKTGVNQQQEIEFRVFNEDKQLVWYKLYAKAYLDHRSKSVRMVGILQDINERHEIEEQLNRVSNIFENTAEGIVILDHQRQVESFNPAFETILGYSLSELKQKELPFFKVDEFGEKRIQELWNAVALSNNWQGEVKAFKQNLEVIHLLVNVGQLPSDESLETRYVVMVSDISAMKEAQERLSHIAYFDALTDLPNRTLLMDRFQQALVKAQRLRNKIGVLFLDLDHFKRVNDSFGHQVGDNMLRSVAQRLKSRLRKSDTLGRLGGDEFIVIMEHIEESSDCEKLAQSLLDVLDEPLIIGNHEILPSASIGISVYPHDSTKRQVLIQKADTAMYAAKGEGRKRYAFYKPQMTERTTHYLVREKELRYALLNNQLELHYQPICDAVTTEVIDFEVLIRWNHPREGLLPASEVIPVAESGNLIIEIGRWVLSQAVLQLRRWIDAGYRPVKLSVNVSTKQFTSDNLPKLIERLITKNKVPAEYLTLEITESCLQLDEKVLKTVKAISQMGFGIALDDFGTGFSCLSSLKNLPIDILKIDRSFIMQIPDDADDCAIASAIIAMGHQLNKKVVAEGIETEEQIEFLRKMGCDFLQGYYFDKPQPAQALTKYLSKLSSSSCKLKRQK